MKNERKKLKERLAIKIYGNKNQNSIKKLTNNISSQARIQQRDRDEILIDLCKKNNVGCSIFLKLRKIEPYGLSPTNVFQKTTTSNIINNSGNISNSSIIQSKKNGTQPRQSNRLLRYVFYLIRRLFGCQ